MSAEIEFFFDFSSPYGYLAAESIEEIGNANQREVVWKPYLMGALFKKFNLTPLVNSPLKGSYAKRDIKRTADYLGIPFTIPEPFPVNSVSACRPYYSIVDDNPQIARKFALRIMRNYFQLNINLSDSENILKAASEEGLDVRVLSAKIENDTTKERLRFEVDKAIERGVFGSPIFIVENEMFWGTDRLDQLTKWIVSGSW